jgi:hemerythrin
MPLPGRDFRMSNSAPTDDYNPSSLYWTKNLLIGHTMIDADHRRVFDLANKLRAEFLEEPEQSIVGEVLVELIEHTGDHFLREEALMRAIRFPGYEKHKQEHTTLMDKVNDLHLRFMEGNGSLAVEVSKYLHEWLVPHIMHADMELGRSLRSDR